MLQITLTKCADLTLQTPPLQVRHLLRKWLETRAKGKYSNMTSHHLGALFQQVHVRSSKRFKRVKKLTKGPGSMLPCSSDLIVGQVLWNPLVRFFTAFKRFDCQLAEFRPEFISFVGSNFFEKITKSWESNPGQVQVKENSNIKVQNAIMTLIDNLSQDPSIEYDVSGKANPRCQCCKQSENL